MNRIAHFEKVSYQQYRTDYLRYSGKTTISPSEEEDLRREYESIKLPVRSTTGSAGYDFFIPHAQHFRSKMNIFFSTGIRCKIQPGWVLILLPKSGLGSNYGMRLLNTTGVVDSDYYGSSNEGHIMAGLTVSRDVQLNAGDKFMQGIFLPYGITDDDQASGIRDGGFGSTGAK